MKQRRERETAKWLEKRGKLANLTDAAEERVLLSKSGTLPRSLLKDGSLIPASRTQSLPADQALIQGLRERGSTEEAWKASLRKDEPRVPRSPRGSIGYYSRDITRSPRSSGDLDSVASSSTLGDESSPLPSSRLARSKARAPAQPTSPTPRNSKDSSSPVGKVNSGTLANRQPSGELQVFLEPQDSPRHLKSPAELETDSFGQPSELRPGSTQPEPPAGMHTARGLMLNSDSQLTDAEAQTSGQDWELLAPTTPKQQQQQQQPTAAPHPELPVSTAAEFPGQWDEAPRRLLARHVSLKGSSSFPDLVVASAALHEQPASPHLELEPARINARRGDGSKQAGWTIKRQQEMEIVGSRPDDLIAERPAGNADLPCASSGGDTERTDMQTELGVARRRIAELEQSLQAKASELEQALAKVAVLEYTATRRRTLEACQVSLSHFDRASWLAILEAQ